MKVDRKYLNNIQSLLPVQIFFAYCFITSGLIVNFLQLLTWIFIWPFSKPLYRILNHYLSILIWSQFTFLYSYWANSDLTVYIDPKDLEHLQKEHALFFPNHRYEIDWLLGLVFSKRFGLLGGTKIVGKHSLSFMPAIGWSWFFTESIFIRLGQQIDTKKLEHDVQQLVNNYPDNYYFDVFMTCEGARYTEIRRVDSMKYAREKNLPELKYHILPRTKGATIIMKSANGKIAAVYNSMLVFSKDSASPKLRTLLNGHYCKGYAYVKRIPMSEIPYEDEEKCAEWIHKAYQEKDRICEHFLQHDTFEGLGVPEATFVRNYSDLFIEIFWLGIVGVPSLVWFIKFIISGTLYAKILCGIILLIVYVLFQWLISMSVVKIDTKAEKKK